MKLKNASEDQLQQWAKDLTSAYQEVKARGLNLDLTRGKPSSEQLSLSDRLDGILDGNYITASGVDTRNYGGLEGLDEARALGSWLLDMPAANVLAAGNSSLTLMHQTMSTAYYYGLTGADSAWSNDKKTKCLCPVPGYDRHFTICEQLGIEMITVPMTESGPDMDQVEKLVANDHSIKCMWSVPKYSNPTGVVYSREVVDRIAQLGRVAAPNFRVFWDNAYTVHDLADPPTKLASIYYLCKSAGTEDSVLQFASTSKITFSGAGVAFMGASESNLAGLKKALGVLTIGPDKVNQLRHVKFFTDEKQLEAHMRKHAEIIKPRFDCVLNHLRQAFAENDMGQWEEANGGYFISFNTLPGLAKQVVKLAAEAGVKLTPAGATFPYGNDPEDRNIRIAPTVPTPEQVDQAMQVFVLCVKLASVQQCLTK